MSDQLQFGAVLGAAHVPGAGSVGNNLSEQIAKTLRSLLATDLEKAVLQILDQHRGHASAIKSSAIAEQLVPAVAQGAPHSGGPEAWRRMFGSNKETARRAIAGAIENLVELHHIKIGGLRVPPYGYFLIETRADLDLAIQARWGEIYAHLRYVRALTSKADVAKLFGQKMLELDRESEGEVA